MKIIFIQTGGSIDKDYPQNETNHGYEFKISGPSFRNILNRAKPDFEYEVLSVLKKDSLDITDEDRQNLFDIVKNLNENKIVITHGTDTIQLTAKKLSEVKNKKIVLTGAMIPEKFKDSDADFNLGMAVAGVQFLSDGVYIALFGKLSKWEEFENK